MVEIVDLDARRRVNTDVVSLLEKALAEAKEGYVAAIGLAIVRPSGHVNCAFTNFETAGMLLGAVALLQSRLIANMEPTN